MSPISWRSLPAILRSSPSERRDHLAGFQQVSTCGLPPKIRRNHHINDANEGPISPDMHRRGTPGRTPPIDPLPQHRELCRGQPGGSLRHCRPREAPALQQLAIEAKALTIPIQKLDPISPSAAKGEDSTTCRFLAQHILGQRRQTRDTLAHIRHLASHVDANASPGTDHAPSTARISTDSAVGSIVLSKCKLRPPSKRNSTATGGDVSAALGCAVGTGISKG